MLSLVKSRFVAILIVVISVGLLIATVAVIDFVRHRPNADEARYEQWQRRATELVVKQSRWQSEQEKNLGERADNLEVQAAIDKGGLTDGEKAEYADLRGRIAKYQIDHPQALTH